MSAAATLIVDAATLAGIAPGASKCVTISGHHLIIAKAADGGVKACANKCVHLGGTFVADLEDAGKMKCSLHGMKLNPSTMSYVEGSNPKALGFTLKKFAETPVQPQLTVSMNPDGSATLGAPAAGGCSLQ